MGLLFYYLETNMTQTLKNPNRLVVTEYYHTNSKRKQKLQEDRKDLELNRELQRQFIPFLFGDLELLGPTGRAMAMSIAPDRLAEMAVAQLFGVKVEPAGNEGFDVDTSGILLDGHDYGRIEVRSRSLRLVVDKRTGRKNWRIDPLGEKDVRTKRGKFDWVFACMWNHFEQELVWFRVPHDRAVENKSLVISRGVKGNYGWADEYLWDGPIAEHASLYH